MKFLFSIIAFVLFNKECDSAETSQLSNESNSAAVIETLQDDNLSITYTTHTRGFYEAITLSKSSLKISKDRNEKNAKIYDCSAEDWEHIKRLLNDLETQNISQLIAPTEKRHSDGALIATVMVSKDKKDIKTQDFDHGHPPKEIEALVNKVLSIKENAIKQ